ncbi:MULTISPECIES: polysaccharide biosynthesis tyrosine autokinase [unclassified Arthrobacter]|uniref:polysaccharide biosynthesis tyrosine autokinase n=1 Tax=unclassified Arthrobacter TaxID=235627 RepID=UPI000B24AE07|nr:polysaccharide biosynthesis tyrosine autokinase [Arthrobacter sp. Leaf234]
MELRDYVAALRKRWVTIVALCLLGALAAFAYASLSAPQYRAVSSVFVSSNRGETTGELVQGSTYTQNLVASFTELATKPVVLDPVIEDLDLDSSAAQLEDAVSAETPLNTVLINITAVSESPAGAANIANGVADSLARVVTDMSPKTESGSPTISISTVATAQAPTFAFAPNTRLLIAAGALVGLVAGIVVALARQLLDTRIHDAGDVARLTDLPILGTIPRTRGADSGSIVLTSDPNGNVAEAYRLLATNLEFLNPDKSLRSIVVSSPLPGEGKSTTAINLALAAAERNHKVLLIDADLRRPSVAEFCSIEGGVGLTTVLSSRASLSSVIEPWESIDVLPCGVVPPNPNQLLSSDSMAHLVKELSDVYDFIVIDSPPILLVADALPLARLTDGAVIVTRQHRTRRGQLAKTLQSLEGVGSDALGVILTGGKAASRTAYYGSKEQPGPTR